MYIYVYMRMYPIVPTRVSCSIVILGLVDHVDIEGSVGRRVVIVLYSMFHLQTHLDYQNVTHAYTVHTRVQNSRISVNLESFAFSHASLAIRRVIYSWISESQM